MLDLVEQAGKEDEQYAAVVRWLQKNRDWLLILDNVDSAEGVRAVQELVAQIPGGQALITSRLTNWGGAIRQTRIDVLAPEAARELLIRRAGIANDEAAGDEASRGQADAVARKLGYLPLALEQAAAYVSQQPHGFGFAGYLRLYESHEAEFLAEPPAEAGYPKSIWLTWRTTVDRLSEGARRILRMHAYLASTAFPVDLYVQGAERIAPGADEFQVRRWIAELLGYSMAAGEANDAISVHGLVQAVERRRAAEDGTPKIPMPRCGSYLASTRRSPRGSPAAVACGICCCRTPRPCVRRLPATPNRRKLGCCGKQAKRMRCVATTGAPSRPMKFAWQSGGGCLVRSIPTR